MENKIVAVASFVEQKYFLEPEFQGLPQEIRDEIKAICVSLAQKLGCTFLMRIYADGKIYFETVKGEDDFNFDEIGAELEIKEINRKKQELFKAIKLWYRVFFTEEGKKLQQELLKTQ